MTPAYLAKLAADHEKARKRLLSASSGGGDRIPDARAASLGRLAWSPDFDEIEGQLRSYSARMKKRPRPGRRRKGTK